MPGAKKKKKKTPDWETLPYPEVENKEITPPPPAHTVAERTANTCTVLIQSAWV